MRGPRNRINNAVQGLHARRSGANARYWFLQRWKAAMMTQPCVGSLNGEPCARRWLAQIAAGWVTIQAYLLPSYSICHKHFMVLPFLIRERENYKTQSRQLRNSTNRRVWRGHLTLVHLAAIILIVDHDDQAQRLEVEVPPLLIGRNLSFLEAILCEDWTFWSRFLSITEVTACEQSPAGQHRMGFKARF